MRIFLSVLSLISLLLTAAGVPARADGVDGASFTVVPDGPPGHRSVCFWIVAAPGETLTFTGHVVAADASQPLAGLSAELLDGTGVVRATGATGADGSYALTTVAYDGADWTVKVEVPAVGGASTWVAADAGVVEVPRHVRVHFAPASPTVTGSGRATFTGVARYVDDHGLPLAVPGDPDPIPVGVQLYLVIQTATSTTADIPASTDAHGRVTVSVPTSSRTTVDLVENLPSTPCSHEYGPTSDGPAVVDDQRALSYRIARLRDGTVKAGPRGRVVVHGTASPGVADHVGVFENGHRVAVLPIARDGDFAGSVPVPAAKHARSLVLDLRVRGDGSHLAGAAQQRITVVPR